MKALVTGLLKGRIIRWSILAAILGLWVAGAPANAKDMIPYADSIQMSVTAVTENPDGTMDQVIEGTGIAWGLGAITLRLDIHIEQGAFEIDPVFGLIYSLNFEGTALETAANGDTLVFSLVGREFVPIDNGNWLWPWRLEAFREVTSGTGRFQGATGTMAFTGTDEDTGISGVSTGEISSVGSQHH